MIVFNYPSKKVLKENKPVCLVKSIAEMGS
jgi:hypothetical protein